MNPGAGKWTGILKGVQSFFWEWVALDLQWRVETYPTRGMSTLSGCSVGQKDV